MVLRITRQGRSGRRTVLRLEGRVVADWAALLEHECLAILRGGAGVRLDLTSVGFVDRAGLDALARLSRTGVGIHGRRGPLASVLEAQGIPVVFDPEDIDEERS